MRRLPGILLVTGATILVVVALFISALRIMLPQLNSYRSQLVAKIQSVTGTAVSIDSLSARWTFWGPVFELHNSRLHLPEVDLQAQTATFSLNVWQSLLRWHWQFEEITFHRLQANFTSPLKKQKNNFDILQLNDIKSLFLYQLNHVELHASHVTFPTSSGTRAELAIPQFIWSNTRSRQRAEGQITLRTIDKSGDQSTHQPGEPDNALIQVKIDIDNNQDMSGQGTIYLKAENINARPWIGNLLHKNTALQSAKFSLSSWMQIKNGMPDKMTLLLKEGQVVWQLNEKEHQLDADNLTAQLQHKQGAWQLTLPALNFATDKQAWPKGSLSAAWLPGKKYLLGEDEPEALRIRAIQLKLDRLQPIISALSFLPDKVITPWSALQPSGYIETLALDVPLRKPEKMRFHAQWQEAGWKEYRHFPGVDHFSGALYGSLNHGRLTLDLNNSTLPYESTFKAPLQVKKASGDLEWYNNQTGLELWSQALDIQAHSLWVNGDFRYQQPLRGQPWLTLLAGIRLYDTKEAWRYFPPHLMGHELANYLSEALQGGYVDNASLIYNGNPHHFPYKNKDGHFEVYAPVHNATFQFHRDWPALTHLAINLDFINDGLWMHAKQATLGRATGSDISAIIPDYLKKKLLIDAVVAGDGQDIHRYFMQTPLKNSVGSALNELQVSGNVQGSLHLDIPLLAEKAPDARGEINFDNNSVWLKSLKHKIDNISGSLRFDNANLEGHKLSAYWLTQPLLIDFKTKDKKNNYLVDIALQSSWQAEKLPGLPASLAKALTGSLPWHSKIALQLPDSANPTYNIDIDVDLKAVTSRLPAPFTKSSGQALPITIKATGDFHAFTLTGAAGNNNQLTSHWIIKNQQPALVNALWQIGNKKIPPLYDFQKIILDFPPLDGDAWQTFLIPEMTSLTQSKGSMLPLRIMLKTPELVYAGQSWQQLSLLLEQQSDGIKLTAKGHQIDGTLLMPRFAPWRADIRYMYWLSRVVENFPQPRIQAEPSSNNREPYFKNWPAVILRCQECWVMGKCLKRTEANFIPKEDSLLLENGFIDMGAAEIAFQGRWQRDSKEENTVFKGKLSGPQLDQLITLWGLKLPLNASSFNIDFDLNWYGAPWKFHINKLNGSLSCNTGKGRLDVIEGSTGQLLRLLSFDALLRKLQFDFSDTFSPRFPYDSIRGSAKMYNGLLKTNDLFIDGLSADIAMEGDIDIAGRQINMKVAVSPDMSATVGTATAIVTMNPAVGAAAFAATKVLAPLWSKVSLIRYLIQGDLDNPQVHEVLRLAKKGEAP